MTARFYDVGLIDSNDNAGRLEDGEGSKFCSRYLVNCNTAEYVALACGERAQTQARSGRIAEPFKTLRFPVWPPHLKLRAMAPAPR